MQQLVCFLQFSDERVSYHLFVDSLKPIELLICFSALVRWGESGGKRAWENYSLKAQLTFHSGKMYTTHFRHRMKELIPSPDLLRSSCSSDIKEYAHSCHPSLSLFWSYGYLFSTPSLSVSLSPYTCHHCWFFKNLTSSFFFDLTLPKAFISIPPRPLLLMVLFRFYCTNNCIISINFKLSDLHTWSSSSRIPTRTILGLSGDHHSQTLQLFLCPPSSDPYFSDSQHCFHGPSLYSLTFLHMCPQHKCFLTLSSYVSDKTLVLVENISVPDLGLHQSSWE